MTPTPDLDELVRLAEAATPGYWYEQSRFEGPMGPYLESYHACGPFHIDSPRKDHAEKARADAKFVAATSPDVILGLVARIRELERSVRLIKAERDRLAADALAILSENGIATPEDGYVKEPYMLASDIKDLARERDEARAALAGATSTDEGGKG